MPPDIPDPLPRLFNLAAYFLDRPAAEHPEHIAVLGEPRAVTYGELAELANRAGAGLREIGCEPGHRVLIALPDSTEFIAAFFGVTKIGAIAVPVNPMTRTADYAYYLADSGAQIAIVHVSTLAEVLPAIQGTSLDRIIVVGVPEGTTTRGRLLNWSKWLESSSGSAQLRPTAGADPAFFLYTSGSGGQPKAAVHRHRDMLVSCRGVAQGVLGLRSDDRLFSVSKLFFAYGLGNGMYFPFSVGASTLLAPERPRAERVIELVVRHRPTVFFAVPTFYAALLREMDRGATPDFSSVRLAVSAGEMLPAEIFEQCRNKLGIEILDGIGSTEMLQMFIMARPGQARPGSCGVEVPGYEARIVDDAGKPVPPGEMGNLWVKGQSAFECYWNNPELTLRSWQGDWMVTGDKFYCDADGYYHYSGRTDDMLKVAGMWVAPGEVENVLLGHPAVAEAAVVGAMDRNGLQRPVAYVVLRRGGPGTRELAGEIQEFVRMRLASYKCPQEVHFLTDLPKTATGKIQRFRLRGPGAPAMG